MEAAQGEPDFSMARSNSKSFLAQDGVRDDESGQGCYLFQLLAPFLKGMDEYGEKLRGAASRLGLRGVGSAAVEA